MIGLLIGMLLTWSMALMCRPPASSPVQDATMNETNQLPKLSRLHIEDGGTIQTEVVENVN